MIMLDVVRATVNEKGKFLWHVASKTQRIMMTLEQVEYVIRDNNQQKYIWSVPNCHWMKYTIYFFITYNAKFANYSNV